MRTIVGIVLFLTSYVLLGAWLMPYLFVEIRPGAGTVAEVLGVSIFVTVLIVGLVRFWMWVFSAPQESPDNAEGEVT